ncbi:hypothetical protein BSY15_3680 [Acidovorax sp. RAC01]|nr:hypothetical protein BSY15_3680 [Acidovorax sp. RAC01]
MPPHPRITPGLPTLLQTLEALGRAQAVPTDAGMAWRG